MDVLVSGARAVGVELDDAQARAFRIYADELLAWNAKFNLTAITERDEIDRKHFLDSLAALPLIRSLFPSAAAASSAADAGPARAVTAGSVRMLDVGAGAGFPGMPLVLASTNRAGAPRAVQSNRNIESAFRLTLLEATRKKCDFLEHLASVLPVPETRVLWGRAETTAHQGLEREQYDLVVARAVAELNVLAEYMLPFARVGGYCLAWKGELAGGPIAPGDRQHDKSGGAASGGPAGEVDAAARAIELLGGRLSEVYAVQVPGLDAARSLVLIEKVAPTPAQYPRREGVPSKRPLR